MHETSYGLPVRPFDPAGSRVHELRASLGEPAIRRAIGSLAGSFDYVVAHVAGSEDCRDAAALGACFDDVVVVVEAGRTTPQATRAAAAVLNDAGVRLLGSVVNSAPARSGER